MSTTPDTTARFDATTTTTCGYCGVGCRLEAHTKDGHVVAISPAADGPANHGHTCVKGRFAHQFTRSRERLTTPLIREPGAPAGTFREATWEEAIAHVSAELLRIKGAHGPDAIAGLASSRATNEDCYVMQRLMRAAIGTNNIDNCSRVCHSPTSFALRASLGLSGATGSFDDIDHADLLFVLGANPTQGHPVVGARCKQAVLRGAKLITADPRRIELADLADVHLSTRPGGNAALLHGLAHVIIRDGLVDRAFVDARTEGYAELEDLAAQYPPSVVEEITGIPAADVERAAHLFAAAENACILWGLGVTEHKYGSEVVRLIVNLALLTGNIGRPGAALLPLRGQNNVQGSSDMGALPDTYTAYRRVDDEATATEFEAAWGVPLSRRPGYTIPQMFDAAVAGDLRAMFIFGEDVAQTDPDTTHVVKALENLELLVCQDIFMTETTKLAHVVLPASAFLEKTGTVTNAERRMQLVQPAVDPPGQARTDFDILTTLSRALGHDMGFADPSEVMDEVARLTPDFAGVSFARLGRRGLQWPVAPDGTDAPILYEDHFLVGSGRAKLAALPYKPPGEEADAEYPLILVTGRRLEHYNAGTMTRRTGNLALMPSDWLEMHPDDAADRLLAEGDLVTVRSRRGEIELPVRITDRIEAGHVFTAFHFPEVRTNLLVGDSADVNTSCPEYKVIAVTVRGAHDEPGLATVAPALVAPA
jgi:formate dehydrogenase major subunit